MTEGCKIWRSGDPAGGVHVLPRCLLPIDDGDESCNRRQQAAFLILRPLVGGLDTRLAITRGSWRRCHAHYKRIRIGYGSEQKGHHGTYEWHQQSLQRNAFFLKEIAFYDYLGKTPSGLFASGQWTLVAWLIHMDHICNLYEYYKSFGKGSEYLVTMYEDRLRHHWHKQCESGRGITLEVEAGKTNEASIDYCRTRIDGVL